MKLLTISIAAYNAEATLKKCLDSMVGSKYVNNIEILVINDGSKDGTLFIAQDYKRRFPESVVIIDKQNGGHGSTINVGLNVATGLFFKTVDADDWVETDGLDKLIEELSVEVDLFVNPYYEVDAKTLDKKEKKVFDQSLRQGIIYESKDCISKTTIAMHAMTIRTSILKEMNLKIDEKCFYVDMEYILFPLPYIKQIKFLKFAVYDYLLGTATQSMNLEVFINRRGQHEKVLKRLYDFYNSITEREKNLCYANVIKKRIVAATYIQYRILLMLPPKIGENEIKKFDSFVPDIIFEGVSGNTKRLLKYFRKVNYKNYQLIITVLQRCKIIKKDGDIL